MMRPTEKFGFSLITGLILCFNAVCQTNTPSVYGAFGIGNLNNQSLFYNSSMAGLGIGLRPLSEVNVDNPAATNSISTFNSMFDFGINISASTQLSEELSTSAINGGMNPINLWFRTSDRFAFDIGLSPYSVANYSVIENSLPTSQFDPAVTTYEGTGGTNLAYLSMSYALTGNLNIGIKGGYVFGPLNQTYTSVGDLIGTIQSQETNHLSFTTIDFGTQYSINLNNSTLTLGMIYSPSSSAVSQVEGFYFANGSDTINYEYTNEVLALPEKLGAGISYQGKSLTLGMDFEIEKWKTNKTGRDFFDYDDVLKFTFGGEFKRDRYSPQFWDQVSVRTGFGINNNYLIVDNTKFNEFRYSFGLNFPVQQNRGAIGLTYSILKRGTLENGLVLEHEHIFGFNITFKDFWFGKTRYF